MAIRAVLFDIDGTLVDSNDHHVAAWQEVFGHLGKDFDDRTVHDQIGKGTDMLVPTLLPDMDKAAEEKLGEAHGIAFKGRFLDKVKPFPGAHDLLARVAASDRQVVLASSASKVELDHYLRLLGAEDIVTATTSADDVAHTKPAPDIFATALGKLAPLTPAEAIVVGDTPYDIEAAGKCGIAAIGVRSGGFTDAALRDAGAIELYDDVAALLAGFDTSPLNR